MNIQLGSKGINWTDATWNPVTGCLHGCPYCYARDFAQRFGRSFDPAFHQERLDEPKKRQKPTKIFVGSNADLFGNWVPDDWVYAVLDIARQCPQHTFQFLTKAPHNLAKFNPWPDNCWLGGTVDIKARLLPTIRALRKTDAPIRFISFEPLNEDMGTPDLNGIEWIIIGAETGKNAHQPKANWVNSLLDSAANSNTAILMKENLAWSPRIEQFPIIRQAVAQFEMF